MVKYKTITIRVDLSGEEESILKAATDLELAVSRKINRIVWWRRLFGKKSSLNLDTIIINQFPNN
jgi:hypothetical protein